MAQSLIALFILEYVRPLKSNAAHKNEIFNEIVMILLLYTFMSFTDWVPNFETKFKLGYVACGLIVLHLMINIFIMLASSIKGAYKACRLRRHINKHNKEREILQLKLQSNRKKRCKRSHLLRGDKQAEKSESELSIVLSSGNGS